MKDSIDIRKTAVRIKLFNMTAGNAVNLLVGPKYAAR
jgi:hypothetical protein